MKKLLILSAIFAVPYSFSQVVNQSLQVVNIKTESDLVSHPDIKNLKVKTKKCREYSFEYCGKKHTWNTCSGKGPALRCDENHIFWSGPVILRQHNPFEGGGHGPVVISHRDVPKCKEGHHPVVERSQNGIVFLCEKDDDSVGTGKASIINR